MVVSIFLNFHSYLRRWSNLTNIFQRVETTNQSVTNYLLTSNGTSFSEPMKHKSQIWVKIFRQCSTTDFGPHIVKKNRNKSLFEPSPFRSGPGQLWATLGEFRKAMGAKILERLEKITGHIAVCRRGALWWFQHVFLIFRPRKLGKIPILTNIFHKWLETTT